jgi:hypothetical protein
LVDSWCLGSSLVGIVSPILVGVYGTFGQRDSGEVIRKRTCTDA